MNNIKSILGSFKIKDELNSNIWEKTDDGYVMKQKVRDRLLKIANDFIEFLDVDIIVSVDPKIFTSKSF
jgi:hypothetical protein